MPILSFGFMFGVLVIGTTISAWNTTGVFVTSTWQAFLALCGLSLVLMSKQNNPVWKYYALKLAEKLRFKKDPKLMKTLEEVEEVLKTGGGRSPSTQGLGGREAPVAGVSPSSNSGLPSANEVAPVRNERPKRFVYGEKKGH